MPFKRRQSGFPPALRKKVFYLEEDKVRGVKITAKEADGNLAITVRMTGLYRLLRFFKVFLKRLGMFNDKLMRF
jgi:hypothetical protein